MTEVAPAFLEEAQALAAVLAPLDDEAWRTATTFKSWSFDHIVQHLHGTDRVALMALQDPDAFNSMKRDPKRASNTMQPSMTGKALLEHWQEGFEALASALLNWDEATRVPWFGPDMGVKMFATARQMETWAHGQAIFDALGVTRTDTDRIKNIAVIGVKTYGWTFVNRGLEVPGPAPYVELTAPSGEVWSFNDFSEACFVEGDAVDFCHVVTQVRHVSDVDLMISGDAAHEWMAIAQCFAGPPESPPEPGSRLQG